MSDTTVRPDGRRVILKQSTSAERRRARRAETRRDAATPTDAILRARPENKPARSRATPMTALQANDWARPATLPYRMTVTTGESRWSQTDSNRNA